MGGIVDRHSDRTSYDEVSERPWWSDKRQRNDRKCAHHTTGHQQIEFGEARRQHDLRDMNKFLDWFRSHDPFDDNVPQLRSLASGLASSEGVASIVVKRRKSAVRYNEVLTVYLSEVQP